MFVAPATLAELREVTSRPKVIAKLRIIQASVDDLLAALQTLATLVTNIPVRFVYERDPDDSIYINLAIEANAKIIVTRDNDLLSLMDGGNPQYDELKAVHADLRVLDPVELLKEVDDSTPR